MDCRIQLVLRLMTDQAPAPRLNARALSPLLMISETHLLRLFKREVGTAFKKYQCELRMLHASTLLLGNDLSIKEVAFAAGYDDVSNFYRDFKHIRGLGPKEWKSRELTRQVASEDVGDH